MSKEITEDVKKAVGDMKTAESGSNDDALANFIKDVQNEEKKFKDDPTSLTAYKKLLNEELHNDGLLLPNVELIGSQGINAGKAGLEFHDPDGKSYIGEKDHEMLNMLAGKGFWLSKEQLSGQASPEGSPPTQNNEFDADIKKTSNDMAAAEYKPENDMRDAQTVANQDKANLNVLIQDVADATAKYGDDPDKLAAYMAALNKQLHNDGLLPKDAELIGIQHINRGEPGLEIKDKTSTTYIGENDHQMLGVATGKSDLMSGAASPEGSPPTQNSEFDADIKKTSNDMAAAEYKPENDMRDAQTVANQDKANMKVLIEATAKYGNNPEKLTAYMTALSEQLHNDGLLRQDAELVMRHEELPKASHKNLLKEDM